MKKFILSALLIAAFSINANASDEYCREFSKDIRIDGQRQPAYGIACLQPDGSWKIAADDDYDKYEERPKYKKYKHSAHNRHYYKPEPVIYLSFGDNYWHNRHHHYKHGWRHSRHHAKHW